MGRLQPPPRLPAPPPNELSTQSTAAPKLVPRTDNLEAWLALWRAESEKIIAISGYAGGHNDTGMRSEDLWWLASNSGRAEERKSGARSLPLRQTGVARDASLLPAGLAGSGDDPPEELARGARASLEISTIRSLPRRSNRVVGMVVG